MFDNSNRKATAQRNGDIVVIRMTGGPDCLWLNMYLDTDAWQMTCDSDIGFYAYRWGKSASKTENFVEFCCRWLENEEWLLRKCIGERHVEKGFDSKKSRENIMSEFLEYKGYYADTCDIESALDAADSYGEHSAWTAAFQENADRLGVDLPEEWWTCIVEDYTPCQKRFAEICREVIVPELEKLLKQVKTDA